MELEAELSFDCQSRVIFFNFVSYMLGGLVIVHIENICLQSIPLLKPTIYSKLSFPAPPL